MNTTAFSLQSTTSFRISADWERMTMMQNDQGPLETSSIWADRSFYDFAAYDPKTYVRDMLNEIYLRAAILIDQPASSDISPEQQDPTEQRVWGYRIDADATVYRVIYR